MDTVRELGRRCRCDRPGRSAGTGLLLILLLVAMALASGGCLSMRAHSGEQYARLAARAAQQAQAIADACNGCERGIAAANAAKQAANQARAAADQAAQAQAAADMVHFYSDLIGAMDGSLQTADDAVDQLQKGKLAEAERQKKALSDLKTEAEVNFGYGVAATAALGPFGILGPIPALIISLNQIADAKEELGRLVVNATVSAETAAVKVMAAGKVLRDIAGGLGLDPKDDRGNSLFAEFQELADGALANARGARNTASDDPEEAYRFLQIANSRLQSAQRVLSEIRTQIRSAIREKVGGYGGPASLFQSYVKQVQQGEKTAREQYEEARRQLQAAREACPVVAEHIDQTDHGDEYEYVPEGEDPDMSSGDDPGGGGRDGYVPPE